MKVLVTGGAGFIGSHVADLLLGQGYEVHVLDDLSSGSLENVPEAAVFHRLDIRSQQVAQLFVEERFDILLHHAAQMDVRRSVRSPGFDADVNIIGLLNLMEAGRKSGLKKVVFASTGGAIYGEPVHAPQTEDHPLCPVSPYGVSKLAGEKYLGFYAAQYGIAYVALRYANVYGPRQNPHGEAGVVAIFAQRLLGGGQPVINGDGLQTRDYVYVSDVAQANLAAVAYRGESEVINIGTGRETDVVTIFQHLHAATGASARTVHADTKEGEQRRSVLSYEKARQLLGWTPRIPVKEGLVTTARWFAERRTATGV